MYWKSDPMFVCRLEDKDLPALGGPAEKASPAAADEDSCSSSAALSPSSSPRSMASGSGCAPGKCVCSSCGLEIVDKYLLKVNDLCWHVRCLSCSVCRTSLGRHTTHLQGLQESWRITLDKAMEWQEKGEWVQTAREQVRWAIGKKFFPVRVVRPWHRLPRDTVAAPSLEGFKARLDGAQSNTVLWKIFLPMAGGGNGWVVVMLMLNAICQCDVPFPPVQVWFQNCRARHKKHVSPNHSSTAPVTAVQPSRLSPPMLEEMAYSAYVPQDGTMLTALHSYMDAHSPTALGLQPLLPHSMTQLPLSHT
ncbi:LHX8 protein, partial [Xiphorhynchus elegans]|nr:LHX8 protein [Xiphorhynchus elegans]